MIPDWVYVVISVSGSFVSAYVGVRTGLARMEERWIAISHRVDELKARLDAKEHQDHRWRHDEYAPEISHIWADLRPLKAIVERMERFTLGGHRPNRNT